MIKSIFKVLLSIPAIVFVLLAAMLLIIGLLLNNIVLFISGNILSFILIIDALIKLVKKFKK